MLTVWSFWCRHDAAFCGGVFSYSARFRHVSGRFIAARYLFLWDPFLQCYFLTWTLKLCFARNLVVGHVVVVLHFAVEIHYVVVQFFFIQQQFIALEHSLWQRLDGNSICDGTFIEAGRFVFNGKFCFWQNMLLWVKICCGMGDRTTFHFGATFCCGGAVCLFMTVCCGGAACRF